MDQAPIGVVEAKKEGDTLTGVELRTTKYSEGVPDNLTTPRRPLPFQYQSTGVETLVCMEGSRVYSYFSVDELWGASVSRSLLYPPRFLPNPPRHVFRTRAGRSFMMSHADASTFVEVLARVPW